MKHDLLEAATRALRDEHEGEGEGARFTRARVMASLHGGKIKRRTRWAFLLPIAACLLAGTAFGAATGRLPVLLQVAKRLVGVDAAPPPARSHAATSSKSTAASVVATAPSVDVSAAPASAPVPSVPPPTVAPSPAPAVASTAAAHPAAPSSAAFRDPDGDLYRLAHEAHFVSHDYARALQAWEAYLTAAPSGRFAVEARYNRAICLLRLGRNAEARKALEPFASAANGAYRQSEARALLSELPP